MSTKVKVKNVIDLIPDDTIREILSENPRCDDTKVTVYNPYYQTLESAIYILDRAFRHPKMEMLDLQNPDDFYIYLYNNAEDVLHEIPYWDTVVDYFGKKPAATSDNLDDLYNTGKPAEKGADRMLSESGNAFNSYYPKTDADKFNKKLLL